MVADGLKMFVINLLVIFFSVFGVKATFNMNNVLVLQSSELQGGLFSYSLLLQRGEQGEYSVIVGAPSDSGGNLYKCDLKSWETGLIKNSSKKCTKYPTAGALKTNTKENAPHGNLLGINVAGEDYANGPIVACAPRELSTRGRVVMNKFYEPPFLRGHCVYIKNSSDVVNSPTVELKPFQDNLLFPASSKYPSGESYYDFAFGMAGFDVSYYSQNAVFFGAPGRKSYTGTTASYSLNKFNVPTLLPKRDNLANNQDEDNTYFGYSVTTAKFGQNEDWFVAGAPRGNNLKGKVEIFSTKPEFTLKNDEFGSYFGSAVLAVDVTGDRMLDILVAAPSAGGKTYDEGCVYFYRMINKQLFMPRITLTGSPKEGARFGTAMASLGDIDLDGYNDIAISAPYEDFGTGAVYIFKGNREGLKTYSQRLTPASLGLFDIKGFGLGMSKGNDVDGNGHNDVAIGAYKSDTFFIFKTDTIVDFNVTTDTQKTVANASLEFNFNVCVSYSKRSRENVAKSVDFEVKLDMDYRLTMEDMDEVLNVPLNGIKCKNYRFGIRPNVINDISPLEIKMNVNSNTANLQAYGKHNHVITVPFVYGCGDDNICNTDLSVNIVANPSFSNIILGLNKQIDLTVQINNNGEPSYKCELTFLIPDGLELRNPKECNRNDNVYTCLVDNRLVGTVNKHYILDVVSLSPDTTSLTIMAEISSLGDNGPGPQQSQLIVPVVLDSLPYIIGSSSPENLALNMDALQTTELSVHQFSIGKNGPSPLPINLDIFVPVMEQDGESVFTVVEVEAMLENMEINCMQSMDDNTPLMDINIDFEDVINRTLIVNCNAGNQCVKYSCKGGYLYKSGQIATFKVKTLIRPKLLVKKFSNELKTKDIIAYVALAYQYDPKNHERIPASSKLLIFITASQMVPLWICMLAVAIGVLLLILLGYGLYRCHFFDRNYKDMLEQEMVLDPADKNDDQDQEEFGDEVVLREIKSGVDNSGVNICDD